jgi:hypothetical protein
MGGRCPLGLGRLLGSQRCPGDEQGAAPLESVIDYHGQAGMDQMAGDETQPAAKLDVLREGKMVRKAMLAEVGHLV